MLYNGSIYNVSNVTQITGRIDQVDQETRESTSIKGIDKKTFERKVKEDGPMFVRMYFDLDGDDLVYRATEVSKWSDYSRMEKDFNKAGGKIADLLKDKKDTQIELR